ncbi:MAG: GH116 family glycosyl hydrolase [Saprospiraceae bacterium]
MSTIKYFLFAIIICFGNNSFGQTETYKASSAVRSGIALGGIGTGSIELRKDGNFYNWSIFNNYPHGGGPILDAPILPNKSIDDSFLFFLVRYQVENETPQLKLLQINNSVHEGGMTGISYYYPWMDAIESIEYSAKFPFVNMKFTDSEMPFDITLEAFSPFVPHDVKNSSLPGVYFNFEVVSKTDKKVDVMILGTLRNLIGYDDVDHSFDSKLIENGKYKFFSHAIKGMDTSKSSYGHMGLGVIGGDEISYYLGWEHKHPYYEKLLVESKLANIDDTENRNIKNDADKIIGRLSILDNDQRCFSSIAASHQLTKGKRFKQTFFMSWDFPNNYGAVKEDNKSTSPKDTWENDYGISTKPTKNIGHYYQNSFSNIDDLSAYMVNSKNELNRKSHQFLDNYYQSDLEEYVLNQVNSHLNTFITSSVLTKNGEFLIREGLSASQQWGPMNTADVSLYGSQMTIALFPSLQKSLVKAHSKLQTKKGEINHGIALDPDYNLNGTWGVYDRVDLVPNYIQMALRDYFWTNDKAFLHDIWPSVKLGIEYMLNERDKDGDQMPDMDGIMCSYDNFPMYGLASYIQSQWIVATMMASQAAKDMGEVDLEKKYNSIAKEGIKLMEDKLWNGNYYRLSNDYKGEKGVDEGCLTDQLIGQWIAHTSGMGQLFDKKKVETALNSIMEMSFSDNKFLRNCSWPEYPNLYPIETTNLWCDQANTPWTGVELGFASFLIYEGMVEQGLQVIEAIDKRHRKNGLYWDHQEFGGHYYRPMSSWSIINAFLGLSINRGVYTFAPQLNEKNFKLFFSGPNGTAFYSQKDKSISIESLTGSQEINKLIITSNLIDKEKTNVKVKIKLGGKKIETKKIILEDGQMIINFDNKIIIQEGKKLELEICN